MTDPRRAPVRKNSEMYFVITSLTAPPPPLPEGPSEPDATDFAPDRLEGFRADIVRMLEALAGQPIELRPPERKLRLRVSGALSGITGYLLAKDRVLMLSAGGMIADAAEYPRDPTGRLTPLATRTFVKNVRGRMASSFADTIVARYDALLMEQLGPKAHSELGRLVNQGFARMRFRPWLPHVAALCETIIRPYRECLRLQVGLIAADRKDLADRLVPFTDLFCLGNFPLGTMDDGSFLVMVA